VAYRLQFGDPHDTAAAAPGSALVQFALPALGSSELDEVDSVRRNNRSQPVQAGAINKEARREPGF